MNKFCRIGYGLSVEYCENYEITGYHVMMWDKGWYGLKIEKEETVEGKREGIWGKYVLS